MKKWQHTLTLAQQKQALQQPMGASQTEGAEGKGIKPLTDISSLQLKTTPEPPKSGL